MSTKWNREDIGKNYLNHALRNKFGHIFEYACECGKDIVVFAETLLQDDLFDDYFLDNIVQSQSHKYIYDLFAEEEIFATIPDKPNAIYDKDIAYWMGYLIAEWHQLEDISGKEIVEYGIQGIYDDYIASHTVSVPLAIEFIKDCGKVADREKDQQNDCEKE